MQKKKRPSFLSYGKPTPKNLSNIPKRARNNILVDNLSKNNNPESSNQPFSDLMDGSILNIVFKEEDKFQHDNAFNT